MSKNRYSARADANQPDIVKKLRAIGATVQTGMDDILIGYRGRNWWVEIKDPTKTLNQDGSWKAGALKESQKKLQKEWRGQYLVAHSFEDIMEVITQ
jgi:hypothetical protein